MIPSLKLRILSAGCVKPRCPRGTKTMSVTPNYNPVEIMRRR
jgi:hypothetical protein